MIVTSRRYLLPGVVAALLATADARAQQVQYETGPDGVKYQVTRTTVNRTVPVTENLTQTQTTYRQQVVTENQQFQQVYRVPVTQYQLVTRIHGRWNPFVTPYYTHEYEPVTSYQQQVATVTMPVTRISWAPETRTVETPVTRYAVRPVEVTERVALSAPAAARPLMAANSAPAAAAGPSATIATRPSAPISSAAAPYGGRAMTSDPPRQGSGWQAQTGSRYQ
ncbi:MAG: hypothetical protein KDA44_10370 [Planctomycetales bacterium]|nr:hypothetical protein [Planctomycetales bacterium]